MAHLLLIDDDPLQLDIRRRLLERAAYSVTPATTPDEALACLTAHPPHCILMDLRLPDAATGRALLRDCKRLAPDIPVIVLTGLPQDLESAPERPLAGALLRKPVRSESLFSTIRRLALCYTFFLLFSLAPALAQIRDFPFSVANPRSELVADLELSSPGADWARAGAEAALVRLTIAGLPPQHVIVYGGPRRHTYSVFLGRLPAGSHTLRLSRDSKLSAENARLEIHDARVREINPSDPSYLLLAHAPILYPRSNTLPRFSDIPLLTCVTRSSDRNQRVLEYTVIFSNEDGGTSTRSLMARWGRPTDIEYIYRVWLDSNGAPARTLIQTRDHKDIPYDGRREAFHPVLEPVTDNNMVEPARGNSLIRFQLAPVDADLANGSRELVMDQFPLTYSIAARELLREKKLRAPGSPNSESISDPRNYLTVELKLNLSGGAVQILAGRRNSNLWAGSSTGRAEDFITRSGWVRAAIELPPNTAPDEITALAVQCMIRPDNRGKTTLKTASCAVEAIGKVFFLGNDYLPRSPLRFADAPAAIEAGALAVFRRQP